MKISVIKKSAIVLTVILLLSTAFSCSLSQQNNENTSVVATNFPAYDFARHVCGNAGQVTMLLPAGAESHSYEPTARDIAKIQNCDLFIYTGGESDAWVDKILNSLDKKINTLKMTECVSLLHVGGEHTHEDGEHCEFDEHVWTSPVNAKAIVNKIKDKLCEIDIKNKQTYEENATIYANEISALDKDFRAFFDTVSNKTLVFGDRFPLLYFTHEYGISYVSPFSGCADHSEASAAKIAKIIKKIDSENISTIYYIEFSNQNIANTIASSTGCKTALFYSCHNVSKSQLNSGVTYVSLMKENLQTLKSTMK